MFTLVSSFKPEGDQPQAIEKLVSGLRQGMKEQVLVGVTGSGKTFTMANIIRELGRPTLVISHNKTLAAQLYSELKEFFPSNAVEYFVSYYDYYQPEAYIPHTDTYIEKDASINDDLDRLRLAATSSLLSRKDAIIVASVSCIYGLGSPEDWAGLLVQIERGQTIDRDDLIRQLVAIQYARADSDFKRGSLRVRGDVIEIFPSYRENPYRIQMSGDKVEQITLLDKENFTPIEDLAKLAVYPAKHFVSSSDRIKEAIKSIETEAAEQVRELERSGKMLEAKRLHSRTMYDLEMLQEVGYCSGIENYSRHLSGRLPGSKPYTLIDYFPKDFLTIIDESHATVPQIRGMYNGDLARKKTLVEHGFRLPSALDNRPLNFAEFEKMVGQVIYVSATPGPYEMNRTDQIVEQIIRPTGLMDPEIEVRPTKGQIDDLVGEIKKRAAVHERVLVTTLTKRMSEDLTTYLKDMGVQVRYLHSEIDAIKRMEILRDLRMRKFDCLVGINLLREGLDLPEVSLVVILDADKEGFLRSDVSLIQTSGRAARNVNGRVIMYADQITDSMRVAIQETERRRKIQGRYNQENNVTPTSIVKAIRDGIESVRRAEEFVNEVVGESREEYELKSYVAYLKERMERASVALDFEKAARFRDEIRKVESEYGMEVIPKAAPKTKPKPKLRPKK
ncbi:MAG: excinuclease ABC subunit UvrB [Candidatus Omnitrophica bacterium]|nr:excinuclease ABC subunit UvrB [Candidatus Omnitrophota bacterium]